MVYNSYNLKTLRGEGEKSMPLKKLRFLSLKAKVCLAVTYTLSQKIENFL
jgi:hypothetical protein